MKRAIILILGLVLLPLCFSGNPIPRNNSAEFKVVFVRNYGNSTNMMGWWSGMTKVFDYYLVNGSTIDITILNSSTVDNKPTVFLNITINSNGSSFGGTVTTNESATNLNLGLWGTLELGFVVPVSWENIENVCKEKGYNYIDQGKTVTIEFVEGSQRTVLVYEKSTGLLLYGYGEFTYSTTTQLEIVRVKPAFVEEAPPTGVPPTVVVAIVGVDAVITVILLVLLLRRR